LFQEVSGPEGPDMLRVSL